MSPQPLSNARIANSEFLCAILVFFTILVINVGGTFLPSEISIRNYISYDQNNQIKKKYKNQG
nr:hypothetical protein [Candidatus Prometheoarchaeum syntrophicum]